MATLLALGLTTRVRFRRRRSGALSCVQSLLPDSVATRYAPSCLALLESIGLSPPNPRMVYGHSEAVSGDSAANVGGDPHCENTVYANQRGPRGN